MERRSVMDDEAYRARTRESYKNMRDARETEESLIDLLQDTAINVLRATSQVTMEAVKVTRDVVKGTLEAGEDVGTGIADSARSLAKATIGGAIDTAAVLGSSAVNTASTILAGMAAGMRQITRAATGDRPRPYNRASSFEDTPDPAQGPFSAASDPDLEAEVRAETGPRKAHNECEQSDPCIMRSY